MKRGLSLLLVLTMLLSLALISVSAEEPENLMPGGSFDVKDPFWGLYSESGGKADFNVQDGVMTVTIDNPGFVMHAVQIYCDGFDMLQGGKYTLDFDMTSSAERYIEWRIQVNGGDYHAYAGDEKAQIGPEATSFHFEFTMQEPNDFAPRFCFNMGDAHSEQGLGAHVVTIDNVVLKLVDASNVVVEEKEDTTPTILVNQLGYRPGDAKVAVIRTEDTKFYVKEARGDKVVYTGQVKPGATGGSSGDTVGWADFSYLNTPGTYVVSTDNGGDSYSFVIADYVYDSLLKDVTKMLYMQRCGTELTAELASDFAHPICHTETAQVYGGDEILEVSGGWHDAGDYGRYAGPGAKTVADLLLAYEMNPDVFGDDFGIPESGNGISDVLDEARWELEWLMKVQRPDGGVYHKVTGLNFDGTIMPQDCTAELFAMPVSATATGDVAAVLFMAARIYQDVDADFAAKCLDAAWLSLSYSEEHRADSGFHNPGDVLTGEYPDDNAQDEYLWAICEAYKTTGDAALAEKIASFDTGLLSADGMGWIDMSGYAYYASLTAGLDCFRSNFEAFLASIADVIPNEAYHSSIEDDYPWGSNLTIANNGIVLLMARDILGDAKYEKLSKTQLDYILGVNPNTYCFITGVGSLYPEHPHHRPSQSVGTAVKGMLVGGPNNGLEDPIAAKMLRDLPKAVCYIDNDQSYSCNEIAIYWNSPLICLLGGLLK